MAGAILQGFAPRARRAREMPCRYLYSPSCREEAFWETELPITEILGNWVSGKRGSRKPGHIFAQLLPAYVLPLLPGAVSLVGGVVLLVGGVAPLVEVVNVQVFSDTNFW